MQIKIGKMYRIILLFIFIVYFLDGKAQEFNLDSIVFDGKYEVKMCCKKSNIYIIDLMEIENSENVYRLVFLDSVINDKKYNVKVNDTLLFNNQLVNKYKFYHHASSYFAIDSNKNIYIIYRSNYENKINAFFFLNEFQIDTKKIKKKCPNRVIHRDNWWFLNKIYD